MDDGYLNKKAIFPTVKNGFNLFLIFPFHSQLSLLLFYSSLPCSHPLLPHHHHRGHREHPGGAGGGSQQEHEK